MESQECCFQRNHLMMRILLGHSHTGRTPSYSTTNLHHIWVHTYVMSYEFYTRWKVSSWGCAACQNKGKVGGYMCNMHQPQGGGFNHWAREAKQRKDFCETGLAAFWCADRYIKCTENTGLAAFLVHRQVQCTPSAPKYLPCTMQISTNITIDKSCHL